MSKDSSKQSAALPLDGVSKNTPLSVDLMRAYLRHKVFAPQAGKKEQVGVEIERFVVRRGERGAWSGILHEDPHRHEGMLLQMAQDKGWKVVSEEDEQKNGKRYVIIGYDLPEGMRITFEPGKQIEHSTAPHRRFVGLIEEVNQVRQLMLRGLQAEDPHLHLLSLGSYPFAAEGCYDPSNPRLLVPKRRYSVMAKHFFAQSGPWGYRLMIQAASNQVCMDVGTTAEEVAARYSAANLLVPWLYGIFAFSPFIDGRLSPYASVRSRTAQIFDPVRSGLNHGLLRRLKGPEDARNFSWMVESYGDFLLSCPLIYLDPQRYPPLQHSLNFGTWIQEGYRGHSPTLEDLQWHLSLVFPEVRLKQRFYELRSPDGQAQCWEFLSAVFYLCLLLDEKVRDRLITLLLPEVDALENRWSQAHYGLKHREVADQAVAIMELALEGASQGHEIFRGAEDQLKKLKVFAHHFTFRHRTPADDLRDLMEKHKTATLTESLWQELMDHWQELIEKS